VDNDATSQQSSASVHEQETKKRKRAHPEPCENQDVFEIPDTQNSHQLSGVIVSAVDGVSLQEQSIFKSSEKSTILAKDMAHIRFTSNEPNAVTDNGLGELQESQKEIPASHAENDDEAPESLSNSAQLLKLKAESRKQEGAKKRFVINLTT
jgi:hypothetical protein